jgi:XTP/dITP diphosphohydrolase
MCSEGEAAGEITLEERKGKLSENFGFDPIFKPDGSTKTFAEMPIIEKNQFSHRATAIQRFAEWYRMQVKSEL